MSTCYPSSVEYGEEIPKDVAVQSSTVDFQDAQFSLPARVKDKVLKFYVPSAEGWMDGLQNGYEQEVQLKTAGDG